MVATTHQSRTLPLGEITEERRTTRRWIETWSPTTVSRAAGVCALAFVAGALLTTGNEFHSDMSAQQVLTWVGQNQQAIWMDGFLSAMGSTVFGLMIILIVALTTNRGILATTARVAAAGSMATGWTGAGMEYALADLAHRGGADAGILALFSLAKTMDYTDSTFVALAVGSVSVMVLRSRLLPSAVAWLGLLVAVWHVAALPVQIAVAGTGNGPQGPIGVLIGLLWLVVTGIVLLVKPVRLREASTGSVQMTA